MPAISNLLTWPEFFFATRGNLVFKSPNTIKWEYTSPYHYSIIFSKNKLYINDSGEKNSIDITSNTIFKSLNDLIVNTIMKIIL